MDNAIIYREAKIRWESLISLKCSFEIPRIQPLLGEFLDFKEAHSRFRMVFEVMEEFSKVCTGICDVLDLFRGFDQIFHCFHDKK